jgi:hypothetical protein
MTDIRVRDEKFVRKPGKTKKDAFNGCKARSAANRAARADWCNIPNDSRDNKTFPLEVCNGRKSRALRGC